MLAFDSARASLSFSSGLLAAVNPCGFVLLPTYLMYFLGMQAARPGTQRVAVTRALKVSLAVSAGFLAVFIVIGSITRWQSSWFRDQAPWISLVIAALLVILGVAMLFGYRLPVTTPKLDVAHKDRSVRAMFVFGVAYAIASIGCTIGPFVSTVLAGINTDGFLSGVGYIVLYSVAMGLVVVGLTVSLAMANTTLVGLLRRGMQHVETVAGVLVLLSGLYLFWYWYSDLSDNQANAVTSKAEAWQARMTGWIGRHETPIVVILAAVIVGAVGLTVVRIRRAQP